MLLSGSGEERLHCFSSDGTLFAALYGLAIKIWKFVSDRYTLLGMVKLREMGDTCPWQLLFSQDSSSILYCGKDSMQVSRLDYRAGLVWNAPPPKPDLLAGFPTSGTYVVTAPVIGTAITITNFHSKNSLRFIDTGLTICSLALAGNTLLVCGRDSDDATGVMAWRLSAEGTVDGAVGNGRSGHGESLWALQLPVDEAAGKWPLASSRGKDLEVSVVGQVGVISLSKRTLQVFHIGTGQQTELHSHHVDSNTGSDGHPDVGFRNVKNDDPPEGDWPVSGAAFRKGWVMDPEGKHRMWLPVHWRSRRGWYWLPTATILRTKLGGDSPIIVKF